MTDYYENLSDFAMKTVNLYDSKFIDLPQKTTGGTDYRESWLPLIVYPDDSQQMQIPDKYLKSTALDTDAEILETHAVWKNAFKDLYAFNSQELVAVPLATKDLDIDDVEDWIEVYMYYRFAQLAFGVTDGLGGYDHQYMLTEPSDPNDWYKQELLLCKMPVTVEQSPIDVKSMHHAHPCTDRKHIFMRADGSYTWYTFGGYFDPGLYIGSEPTDKNGASALAPGDSKNHVLMIYFIQVKLRTGVDTWVTYCLPYDSAKSLPTDDWKESSTDYVYEDTASFDTDVWFYNMRNIFKAHNYTPDGHWEDDDPVVINLHGCSKSLRFRKYNKWESLYSFWDMFKGSNWRVKWINVGQQIYDTLMGDDTKNDADVSEAREILFDFELPNTKYKVFEHIFQSSLITKVAIPVPLFKGWNDVIPGSYYWDYGESKTYSTYAELILDIVELIGLGLICYIFIKFGLKKVVNVIIARFKAKLQKNALQKKFDTVSDEIEDVKGLLELILSEILQRADVYDTGELLRDVLDSSRTGSKSTHYRDIIDKLRERF